jgi:hypothetical protein
MRKKKWALRPFFFLGAARISRALAEYAQATHRYEVATSRMFAGKSSFRGLLPHRPDLLQSGPKGPAILW